MDAAAEGLGRKSAEMTKERADAIREWANLYCRTCVHNDDRGTEFLNCQAEHEVQKDVGIACIHYDEYVEQTEE